MTSHSNWCGRQNQNGEQNLIIRDFKIKMESTNSLSWVGDDSEEDAQESESYFFRLYSFVFFTLLELFKVQIVGLNKKYVLTMNI